MNKTIYGIIAVFLFLVVISSATYAYFNNAGTSTNNIFSSGTLDLKLGNGNNLLSDSVTGTFGGGALAPGVCLDPAVLNLKNVGSVAANHIDISLTNTNAQLAAFLRLQKISFDGTDISVADINVNGYPDMQDLAVSGIINKPLTDFSTHPLLMQVCMDASAGNDQQGQTNTVNFTILLDQGVHS